MKGFTIQHSIEELENKIKELEGGGGGDTVTADDVSYDNTSSGLTADDVQEALDELASKTVTAGSVSYDNTVSGMTADDVQEALDELSARLPVKYSLTEQVVGEWVDGSPVYQKTIYCETLPSAKGTGTYDADAANVTNCWVVDATVGPSNLNAVRVNETDASAFQTASMYARCGTVDGALKIYIDVGRDRSSYNAYVTVRYTKTASQAKSRKK